MTQFIFLKCNKERIHEIFPELAIGGVLQKKVFLKISQISQENTYVGVSFLIKLQAFKPGYL